ncbi:hypothetical protein EDD18DRAFT_1350681 [Armillaria luteobubalina]|uniref:Uncharacterized protein n=1 Tax=Armillaria luteobubalina TaxID=153913 RepID=A0AA39QCZ9_9AGAR|nr:hypothetical protein EDD18DRAFT_1350681 [Armillaria luteobubalina]
MSEFIESQLPLPRLALPSFPTYSQSDDPSIYPDPLEPLVLPVDSADITGIQKVTCFWPTSVPLFTFTRHLYLQERKDRIIQILRLGRNKRLGNGLRTASALTHNQYMKIFPEETRILDGLLTSISVCTTFSKDVVYKLDKKIYQELLTRLTNLHTLASSSLQSFGYSALRPPVWAIDTSKGLTANDFEVYALQYRICVENFLYMLDKAHDWDRCLTQIYLDEELLATQRNADRSHLKNGEYFLPAVPPIPYPYPSRSKTSFQISVSNSNWGRVHHDTPRDKEQHLSNSWTINIRGQSCLCVNSKVSESHDLPGPCRCESLTVASQQAQNPNDFERRIPSSHTSIYQGCSPSNHDLDQGHIDGNVHPFHHDLDHLHFPASSNHLEPSSIRFNTVFKAADMPTCNTSPDMSTSREDKSIDPPALDYNTISPSFHHPTYSELCTFRIASSTPCMPFSGGYKGGSLLPRKVRRRIPRLRKQLQQVLHHLAFNFINHQPRRLIRLMECMQRLPLVICLQNEDSQCFNLEKSTPIPSSAHLRTTVRSSGNYTVMTVMETEPTSHSWQSRKPAGIQTTKNRYCYNGIKRTAYMPEKSDPLPQVHARRTLHQYHCHWRNQRDGNQIHSPQKPPSHDNFKLSKGEGYKRIGFMRKLDDLVWDLSVKIHGMFKINIALDNAMEYFVLWGKYVQSDTVSRTNELIVWIMQHDDQHHQYHSHFGNSLPANTKVNSPCDRCMLMVTEETGGIKCQLHSQCLSGFKIDVKRARAPMTITRECHSQAKHPSLFFERHLRVSQEIHQERDYDSRYHCVSPSALHISKNGSSLAIVRNWNTNSPLRLAGKWFYRVRRKGQRMKQRSRSAQKSQRIGTGFNQYQLTTIIYNAASRWKPIENLVRHLLRFTLADIHQAFCEFQIPIACTMLCSPNYLKSIAENTAGYCRKIWHSTRGEVPCQHLLGTIGIGFPGFGASTCPKIMADDALIKGVPKRSLTDNSQSVVFNMTPLKRNLGEKSEHKQLNQNIQFINGPNDTPEENLTTPIQVYRTVPSPCTKTSLVQWSISVVPAVPPSRTHANAIDRKRESLVDFGNETKNMSILREGQQVDTIPGVDEAIVVISSKRRDADPIINIDPVLETIPRNQPLPIRFIAHCFPLLTYRPNISRTAPGSMN